MKYFAFFIGILLSIVLIVTPLNAETQLLLGVTAIVMAAFIKRHYTVSGRFIFASLVAIVSGRYIYWRITQSIDFDSYMEYFFGWGMLFAEFYFLVILILSYIQQLWTKQRKITPLPEEDNTWPSVDIFIPTYNEDLDIVKITTMAAQGIDWPKEKLNIFILDDGRRAEFREFAEKQGVHYITRNDNKGAKAGNMNNALKHSNGDLIAIFDCDHVPTRSFLQCTAGWFLKDKELALLQTPHHFYNDDPFEKNLSDLGKKNPNEGVLFYGLIQDGNDFWNSSFFCGSCAILRRKAIESIGGFATETITEDAHTSLRLHQKGWNSAYFNMPQASGLATDSLRTHIGQRIRWARGMLQIFRTDNPFLIPGLKWGQRICYGSAMLHFLFPLARIVLLTAPLVFLLLDVNIIAASPKTIFAYALPHIVIAMMATFYLQTKFRQIFLTEIYETTLAFHLVGPTLLTLINPRLGKFNVTSKSGSTKDTYFDWQIVWPQILTALVLIGAIFYALYQIFYLELPSNLNWALAFNIFWACVSTIILLLSSAVALEKRDRRKEHRVAMNHEVVMQTDSGHSFHGVISDMSINGVSIKIHEQEYLKVRNEVRENHKLYISGKYSNVSLRLEGEIKGIDKGHLRVWIDTKQENQLNSVVKMMFGRADSWIEWKDTKSQNARRAWKGIFSTIKRFIAWNMKSIFVRKKHVHVDHHNPTEEVKTTKAQHADEDRKLKLLSTQLHSLIVLLSVLALGGISQSSYSDDFIYQEGKRFSSIETVKRNRHINLALKDIGVNEPIYMQGGDSSRGMSFSLRSDEVIQAATMHLRLSISPGLDPSNSQLVVVINGETVHSLSLDTNNRGINEITFPISPYVLLLDNTLEFQVLARKLGDDTEALKFDKSVWVQISNSSYLALDTSRIPMNLDLNNLPSPFFDKRDHEELKLSMILPSIPSQLKIQSATIVSSYWGRLASFRKASFPVFINEIPRGNGIVFMTEVNRPAGFEHISVNGPSLELIVNPNDALGQLLLVKGRTDDELVTVAKALGAGNLLLSGQKSDVSEPIFKRRDDYDAPEWIPSDRPVSFGEIESNPNLEGYGLAPGLLTLNFKMAPDIFLWGEKGIPVTLKFRNPGDQWLDLEHSRLDVLMNEKYVTSIPLNDPDIKNVSGTDYLRSVKTFNIPPYLFYGENQLQFYFDLKTKVSERSYHLLPGNLRVAVDLDSSIDMSSIYRYSKMPNLAYLTQAGLPFSRKADLSETAVVLPEGGADPYTLEALFTFVANISGKTGQAALGITIIDGAEIENYADHDIVFFGEYDNQPLLQKWKEVSPITLEGRYISVASHSLISRFRYKFQSLFSDENYTPDQVVLPTASMASVLFSFQSPLNPQRTAVGFIANSQEQLLELVNVVKSKEKEVEVQGDFVVLHNDEVMNFSSAKPYFVGNLPWYIEGQWYIASNAWLIPPFLIITVLILAFSMLLIIKAKAKRAFELRERRIVGQR